MTTSTATSTQERIGVVTFKGNALTLLGPEIKVGDVAPDFQVLDPALGTMTFSDAKGKVRIISVVPSLDTPVCDAQTRRFNQEAVKLASNIEIWTISMDLPFAQRRWCGAAAIDRVKVFSDHRNADFGRNYGCLVKELRLLARAVFVVDTAGTVRHVEYVREMTTHPNYDAALATAKQRAA